MNKLLLALGLMGVAVAERLWWDLGPNVELVTLAMLLAAGYLGYRWSLVVVVGVMLVTDWVLGNTNILLFTWSALITEAVVASQIFASLKLKGFKRVVWGTGLGVGSSLWFYLWTNFGVWLLDSWQMYADDFSGLLASYIKGLPFLKVNLLSNLVLVALGFAGVEVLVRWLRQKQLGKNYWLKLKAFYGGWGSLSRAS